MDDLPLIPTEKFHHNIPEYSVSEISNILKRKLEENFSYIRVKGEISGLKIAPSGHIYFSLKDNNALINAICWKGVASKLPFKLEEGLEIICIGSITTYVMQSKYQLIVEKFEVAGAGALMALLAKRKELLTKEGIFDTKRKKTLPKYPQIIGVVTSPTGAVIKDILHRLSDRMPVHVIIWPTLVQGEQAASQIAAAIEGFNGFVQNRPDVIIVARGGGSIEDLWAFNEEIVVRAAANSLIPLISAVGHETDTTLIDYASDVRAPTPTAAAELAVMVRSELLLQLENQHRRMVNDIGQLITNKRNFLTALSRGLPNCSTMLNVSIQRFDDLTMRLGNALPRFTDIKLQALKLQFSRLKIPYNIIDNGVNKSKILANRLQQSLYNIIRNHTHKFQLISASLKPNYLKLEARQEKLFHLKALLESFHYQKVLERGFAIIKDENNQVITSVHKITAGRSYQIEMKDGVIKDIAIK
jgi:exodeoxyribonuclease VII large subunit